MRWSAVVVAIFLALPLSALAQETPTLGEPYRILEDTSPDYYASLKEGPGINDPTAYYEFMDMEWLDLTETDEGFLFTLKVVDLENHGNDVGFSDGGFFWIHFRHHDWDYQLQIERPSGQTEIEFFAVLQSKFADSEEWGFLFQDDEGVTFDLEADTVSYFIERDELADSRGAAPYPSRSLTNWWVIASQRSSQAESRFGGQQVGFPWELHDRMPDTGEGEKSFQIQSGLDQSGHARLYSDEPYRASNGEATTFLYTVRAANEGSSTDLFSLTATDVPTSWDVQLPVLGIELDAGETVPLPVLVSTPFGHQHGGTESFILEMTSTTDSSAVGRLEIGVRYLAIPQPAGHHDTVYVHSIANKQTASFNSAFQAAFEPSGDLWFNTYEEDPSDEDVAISAFGDVGEVDFAWAIPLDPTLRLGLDFDLERLGETNFQITAPEPMQDVTVDGRFVLRQASTELSDALVLATFGATGITWDQPNSNQGFQLDITPQEAADYIPYDASNELWLIIELSGTGINTYNQNTVPQLEPGAWFRLPLNEYEDDISDAYTALSGARMEALTPATRDANPGDVILFDVQVSAYEGAAGQYDLELIGRDGDLGQIVTDSPMSVNADPQTATVMVVVPEDTTTGDAIDLFLQATHTTDTQRRGLIRLVVDVDTSQEWEDDTEKAVAAAYLGEEDQESPAPFGLVAFALLGAVLVARRRQ